MKFEYEKKADDRGCVAFIDGEGDLCVKAGYSLVYFLGSGGHFVEKEGNLFDSFMVDNRAIKKFYPGDTITITF